MYLIFDVIVVAVLALFVWRGWKKGLLLSLCGLAVVVVSFLGAGFLADTLDAPLADAIAPKLEDTISEQLALHYDDLGVGNPLDALREMGGLFAWAADAVEDAQGSAAVSGAVDGFAGLARQAATYLATSIAYRVIFVLAFILLFVLLTLLLHTLNLVAKLPGLSICNGLGGGAIGLVKGILVLYAVIACLRVFTTLVTPEMEENTYVLRFFLRSDLASVLFGS